MLKINTSFDNWAKLNSLKNGDGVCISYKTGKPVDTDTITLVKDGVGEIKPPKLKLDTVIDLGYNHAGRLPDRIHIKTVYRKTLSTDWMYEVMSERYGKISFMSEKDILNSMSAKNSECYKLKEIIDRYASGLRFCGNYPKFVAEDKGKKLCTMDSIKNILLYNAIGSDGKYIEGQFGVWIRYSVVLLDNGEVSNDHIVIK